eukprot:jgi/Mesen1/5181/ME000257S04457
MKNQSYVSKWVCLLLLIAVSCSACAAQDVGSEDAAETIETISEPKIDISKLRIKDLRSKLLDRGLECTGCAEKRDYVEMLRENWHLPVLSDEQLKEMGKSRPKPPTTSEEFPRKKYSEDDLQRLMDELKAKGGGGNFETFKNFAADKFGDYDPRKFTNDDEFADFSKFEKFDKFKKYGKPDKSDKDEL